jgi:hypothetical protein
MLTKIPKVTTATWRTKFRMGIQAELFKSLRCSYLNARTNCTNLKAMVRYIEHLFSCLKMSALIRLQFLAGFF